MCNACCNSERLDGRDTDLANHDAGAEIRERRRGGCVEARCESGGEQGDDRVAGARDVEHLARLRGQRDRLGAALEQRHALLPAGHEQQLQLELGAQRLALAQELRLVFAGADDGFELAAIRRQRVRAAIAFEVRALRIDQHRHARGATGGHEIGRAAQRAFAVVGQDDHLGIAHELREQRAELGRAGLERLLGVDANQLLAASEHAQLVDRG